MLNGRLMSRTSEAVTLNGLARGASIGEANAQGYRMYPVEKMTLLDRGAPAKLVQRFVTLGPVTIADKFLGRDVRLEFGDLGTSYHVNLPMTGYLVSDHRGQRVVATPSQAAVYRPEGETLVPRWPSDCRLLCVKLDRRAVDDALRRLSGRTETPQIAFEPTMDVTTGLAKTWAQMLHMINSRLAAAGSFVLEPMVARPLAESLIHGFLLAASYPSRSAIAAAGQTSTRPPVIREVVEIIENDPQRPLTTTALADECHVSVRALQEGFRRHVGTTPMAYLRGVRLQRAHDALRAADPQRETVSSIALAWGFTHLGRFSAAHTAKYGEPPARTLRCRSLWGTRIVNVSISGPTGLLIVLRQMDHPDCAQGCRHAFWISVRARRIDVRIIRR